MTKIVEPKGRYSVGYCIFGNLICLSLACMVLYSIPTQQTSNEGIDFKVTILARIIDQTKHETGFTQTLISLETGIAAASIALLTITAKSLTDLRFSTLTEMQWEAQRQQIVSFLVWITSLMSSTVATLSAIRIFSNNNTPTDSALAFLVFLMSSIGVVLPSLLRYEKVGNIGNYCQKLQVLTSANNFAKAVGLKIKKTTPSQSSNLFTPMWRLNTLGAALFFSLLILSLITHRFSTDAASVLYVTLVCVTSLWHLTYILINYFTSGDKTEVTFGATVNLLLFTYIIFAIFYTRWPHNHSSAATHGTATPTLVALSCSAMLILAYVCAAFNLILKNEKIWKIDIIRNAYASKVTRLLDETKSLRRSLENVPEPMQPTRKLFPEWVEDELKIPSRLKNSLKSKRNWEVVSKSKNRHKTNHPFEEDKESTPSPEDAPPNISIIVIPFVTKSAKATSTRQRQQGRAGNVRRLRK